MSSAQSSGPRGVLTDGNQPLGPCWRKQENGGPSLAIAVIYRSRILGQLAEFKGLSVVGGKDCEAVTRTPKHDETFKIGSGITVKALHTPCHTQDSICWFMEDGAEKVVFTGDTLFIGGWYIDSDGLECGADSAL